MDKKLKIVRYGILLLVVVSVILMDVKAIRGIESKDVEGYTSHIGNYETKNIQKESLELKFRAVSPKVLYLNLWCKGTRAVEGRLRYHVEDMNGKVMLVERETEAAGLWDEEKERIRLDVSGVEYTVGEQYSLKVDFAMEESIEITEDDNGIMHSQNYKVEYKAYLYIGLVIINLFFWGCMLAFFKWGWNDKLFLVISVVVGLFAVFLTAPFSREDEFRHFLQAYDWSCGGHEGYYAYPGEDSRGHILLDEDGTAPLIKIPRELSELLLVDYYDNYTYRSYFAEVNNRLCLPKLLSVFAQQEDKSMIEVGETATIGRGVESYWPQAIMIWLGRVTGMRSGFWYYLACVGQVLVTSVMLWCAWKLAASHKNLIWFCTFIPANSLLRGSCNPDGLMIAEVVLCVSIVLYLREKGISLMQRKAVALLLGYLILLWQIYKMKMPYALLCLGFLLLLKKENFSFINGQFVKKHKAVLIAAGAVILALALIYLVGIRKGDIFLGMIYRFLPKEHVAYMIENPKVIGVLFVRKGFDLLKETIESLRGEYYIPYALLLLVTMGLTKRRFSVWNKCYCAILGLCMTVLVVLVGYSMTPPDYGQVWGITYRYMLPVWPVAALIFPLGNEKTECYVEKIYPIVFLAALFASCLAWGQY